MFRNRGEVPNINTNTDGNDSRENRGYSAPHYSHYWNGNFIIIQYDKTFVAIELISTFFILLLVSSIYLFTYKLPFEDPIATIKSNFLTAQLISIVISIIVSGLVTFFTKSSKEKLIKNLRIVALVSMLTVIIFWGIKLNINSKYNENTFGKLYEQYEQTNNINSKNSNTISIGLTGVKISSLKETYIDESIKAYHIFSVKSILYMIIHILVVILLFYLSYRLSYIERKKEKLAKDDAILFDEEENVKF